MTERTGLLVNVDMLPPHTFFNPTEAWWEFLKPTMWLHHKRFVDVGAGMGHLTDAMVENGYECRGVDILERAGQSDRVSMGDGADLWLNWDDVAIVARPSHGVGLELILQNLVGESEVLYIDLGKNLEHDLDGYHTEVMAEGVGEDDEKVIRILAQEGYAERWCKIVMHGGREEWWIDDGDRWCNSAGGGFPKDRQEVLDTRLLSSVYQFYETPEAICDFEDEKLRDGWIAPDGEWYPGHYMDHARIMNGVFGITEARAEERGFVRCYSRVHLNYQTWYTCRDKPNRAQRATLRRLDFNLREDFEEERSISCASRCTRPSSWIGCPRRRQRAHIGTGSSPVTRGSPPCTSGRRASMARRQTRSSSRSPRRSNPVAKALADPLFRRRVVKDKRAEERRRRGRRRPRLDEDE